MRFLGKSYENIRNGLERLGCGILKKKKSSFSFPPEKNVMNLTFRSISSLIGFFKNF